MERYGAQNLMLKTKRNKVFNIYQSFFPAIENKME